MSKMDPTAPSAPMLEDDHFVGHHPPPPPSYEQAMSGVQMPGYPPPVQYPPVNPPYPQQPGFVPPAMPVMSMQQNPPPPLQPVVATAQAPAPAVTTVVVSVGPKPCRMSCPVCHCDIKTTTVSENQASAHLCCFLLCILGCCLCSCIPYCMNSFKSVRHSCPNCNAHLGTYRS